MHYDVYKRLLYISLPNEKIVIKLQPNIQENQMQEETVENTNPASYTRVAGVVGKTCIGNKVCGDGGLAIHALLTYPKVRNQ